MEAPTGSHRVVVYSGRLASGATRTLPRCQTSHVPTTLYSASLMTARESWRAIRTIRAEPDDVLAHVLGENARKQEFHMALEQAQQQFAAAERVGYESRPLNLFYGISQAGRAITAGSSQLGRGTDHRWDGQGHGLEFAVNIPDGLFSTPVRGSPKENDTDLFSLVSIATESPRDFESIEFGAIVSQLLDYAMAFQEPGNYLRPIVDADARPGEPNSFPTDVEIRGLDLIWRTSASLDEVREYLGNYPALDGLEVALDDGGDVRWGPNGGCFVRIENGDRLLPRSSGGFVYRLREATIYRRTPVLPPRAGASAEALRPLMAWWLALYALSMLARYSPRKWTKTLSLAESSVASRVEFLLDTAIDAVPELIYEELKRLSQAGGN